MCAFDYAIVYIYGRYASVFFSLKTRQNGNYAGE